MNLKQTVEAFLQDWDNRPEPEFVNAYMNHRIEALRQAAKDSPENGLCQSAEYVAKHERPNHSTAGQSQRESFAKCRNCEDGRMSVNADGCMWCDRCESTPPKE